MLILGNIEIEYKLTLTAENIHLTIISLCLSLAHKSCSATSSLQPVSPQLLKIAGITNSFHIMLFLSVQPVTSSFAPAPHGFTDALVGMFLYFLPYSDSSMMPASPRALLHHKLLPILINRTTEDIQTLQEL